MKVKYQVGDVIDYKARKGRGRPSCGKIIENKGTRVLVEDYAKKQTWVNYMHILREHSTTYIRKPKEASDA